MPNSGNIRISSPSFLKMGRSFGFRFQIIFNSRILPCRSIFIKNSEFAKEAKANPVPFEPKNLGPNVNSIFPEYLPTLTADGKTLIITRKTDLGEDFYIAEWREGGGWSPAEPVKGVINTPQNEGAQCISADGQMLFYTGCNRTLGLGSCDLYVAFWEGDKFGKPVNLGAPVNSRSWESQPSLAGDNKTLFFVKKRSFHTCVQ